MGEEEEEGLSGWVLDPTGVFISHVLLLFAPLIVTEPSQKFIGLCQDESESVTGFVAMLVECLSSKLVLGGSKQKFESRGSAESIADELQVVCSIFCTCTKDSRAYFELFVLFLHSSLLTLG